MSSVPPPRGNFRADFTELGGLTAVEVARRLCVLAGFQAPHITDLARLDDLSALTIPRAGLTPAEVAHRLRVRADIETPRDGDLPPALPTSADTSPPARLPSPSPAVAAQLAAQHAIPPAGPPSLSPAVAAQLAALRVPDHDDAPRGLTSFLREATRRQIADAFGVPDRMLGPPDAAGPPDEWIAHQVEEIAANVTARPSTRPPAPLRIWRPSAGNQAMHLANADILIEPAEGHGRIEGPMEVHSFLVDLRPPEVEMNFSAHPDRPAYAMRDARARVRLHVRAWDPWANTFVTVSHRDALLGLCLAVVRHGLDVVIEDPTGTSRPVRGTAQYRTLPRHEALRWARQVAEVARFLPDPQDGGPSRAREMAGDLGARVARPAPVRVRDSQRALSLQDMIETETERALRDRPTGTAEWTREMLEMLAQARPHLPANPRSSVQITAVDGRPVGEAAALEREQDEREWRQQRRAARAARAAADEDPVALRARIDATLREIDQLAPPEIPEEPTGQYVGGSAWERVEENAATMDEWGARPATYVYGPAADPEELERRRAELAAEGPRDFGWLP